MAQVQPRLILASASPRRLELLEGIGVKPDLVDPADIKETPHPRERPRRYARRMAREKVLAVASRHKQGLVLAADTVVSVGSRIIGKPEDSDEAAAFLKMLSGRRHRVMTAIALSAAGGTEVAGRLVESRVKFARLSGDDISAYLASGEWKGKAGGYAIQGQAARFIVWMEGSHSAIVGLPLHETVQLLKGHGYRLNGKD